MKKIFLSTLLIALMAAPAFATEDGGKRKAKKQARLEAKKAKAKKDNCDPKNCDPNCCDYCPKTNCEEAASCSGK